MFFEFLIKRIILRPPTSRDKVSLRKRNLFLLLRLWQKESTKEDKIRQCYGFFFLFFRALNLLRQAYLFMPQVAYQVPA
jgi:hypothetical protein